MVNRPDSGKIKTKSRTISGSISGIVALVFLGSLFLTAVFFSLPSNVVDTRDGSAPRTFFPRFMPEVWGFFTKPPDSPEFAVYSVTDGSVKNELLFPHTRRENLYGLSRKHRAQGPEIAQLANQTENRDWTDCGDIDGDCVLALAEQGPIDVQNNFQLQTLCGSVVMVETTPVEWSYRENFEGWRKENKAIHLTIAC